MKKIGVLTFHWADNYGAVLQAYGLTKYLSESTQEVELIDFRPLKLMEPYRILFNPVKKIQSLGFLNGIKTIIKSIIQIPYNYKKKIAYINFRKMLPISNIVLTRFSDFSINAKNYDSIIVGSDQVWNPEFFNNYEDIFFLNLKDINTKRISYSASCAIILNQSQISFVESKFASFDFVSIREKSTIQQFSKNKKIYHTVDPIFLLGVHDWTKLMSTKSYNFKYIFVYDLIFDLEIVNFVNDLARKNNYYVITYSGSTKYINHKKSIRDKGPIQFIETIMQSEIVVSSSFHGVAFAILFKKQFYTFNHPTRGIRVKDLLDDLGIKNRDIVNYSENNIVNYSDVDQILSNLIKSSKEYLKESLGDCHEN